MSINDDESIEAVEEAPYETPGRVDPIYEPAVQQYHAPVAETRSFGSRFWWLLPLLLLLIALPILLHRCNRAETCETLPPAVWTTQLQNTTWEQVKAFDTVSFTDDHRSEILNELVYLCNRRLSTGNLGAAEVNHITETLEFAPESSVAPTTTASSIVTLVNSDAFCRCR